MSADPAVVAEALVKLREIADSLRGHRARAARVAQHGGCDHRDSRVFETRQAEADPTIYRRRVCKACGHYFTTYETEFTGPMPDSRRRMRGSQ